ncbi:hypothetical protein [Sulfitobacter sp. S190]|uniref:hypothetical protein n=1 Tax=Sulfitobacter sp. S190 TaxID=2867022 RepID=UPI0021A96DB2|nr:hypothetical protein [Sulfitobacter sp. S190]UWR23600.1 hypothetical protein K3756_06425 [Sulfitobacter sp. S190]
MRRIRFLSHLAMLLVLPMLVIYPYHELAWLYDLVWRDPQAWTRNDIWVDPQADIAFGTRVVFTAVWSLPVMLGIAAYLTALGILWLLRAGVVFDPKIAHRIVWMGAFTVASSLCALLAGALSPMIRSWHNAEGPLGLRFWYDGGNIGLAFSGICFVFFGVVMREAIRIARENEAFV